MKYIVGDNHAKKAYLELQDFKKLQYDNINKNVENDDNITRCRIFENSRSVSRLTTVNGINSRNYVKIYNVSDNKYNYCNIKVLCNDIMIYNGVYVNSLIVPIHVIGEVVIKIELNSDSEILYDLMVDFVGFSNNNSEDVIVSEIDEKVYCVYRGIGDTLVFVYNSYSDFLSKNYSNYYNIPMLLLDAKSIIDTNLFVGKTHVVLGLKEVKPWGFLGDMGQAVHDHAYANGYTVVREIGGHGVGLEFHEEPWVGYNTKRGTDMLMVPGMVFTIEPMVNMGGVEIEIDPENDWEVYTADGKPSAQWEIMVLVTEDGHEVLCW